MPGASLPEARERAGRRPGSSDDPNYSMLATRYSRLATHPLIERFPARVDRPAGERCHAAPLPARPARRMCVSGVKSSVEAAYRARKDFAATGNDVGIGKDDVGFGQDHVGIGKVDVDPPDPDTLPARPDSLPTRSDRLPIKADILPAKADSLPARSDVLQGRVDSRPTRTDRLSAPPDREKGVPVERYGRAVVLDGPAVSSAGRRRSGKR